MIRKLSFLIPIIIMTLVSSCSKDEVSVEKILIGVWERVTINEYGTSTHRIAFADDFMGLDVQRGENTQGQIISVATPFEWSLSEDIISILKDGMPEPTYVIIDNDQLTLIDTPEVSFSKISDDYTSGY